MKIRFHNARLLTRDMTVLEGAELWTNGDTISFAGLPEGAGENFDREIDVGGNLLMPGFKNAHTHSAMTFLRSYADDLPLHQWLNEKIFPMEAKLDGDKVYTLTKLAILEYLRGGVTSALDMYYHQEASARAAVDYGFRLVMQGAVNDFASSVGEMEALYQKFNAYHPLVSYKLGFHAEYTCSKELIAEIAALADRLSAPVYVHNSETRREVEECIARYGKTPTQLFCELGVYKYGGAAFHGVCLSDEDFALLVEHGVWLAHCPCSNLKLASGILPLERARKAGVRLALGTDGPSSNNELNMFREMYLATVLQKHLTGDAAATPAPEVLRMAVQSGAHAMGLPECDSLEAGKKADLVMLDLNQPNMQPLNNIPCNIVYSANPANVKLTMIAGRVLYEDGEFFTGEAPEEIYRRANEIIRGME